MDGKIIFDDIFTNNSNGGYDWGNFIGDLFTGGAVSQADENEWNRQFTEEQFAYQKWLNQLTMDREDTSIQRRVADLKKAGLHPVLATGQGASASSLSSGNSAPTLNSGFNNKVDIADILSLMTTTSQVNKTNAEAEYTRTMADNNSRMTDANIKALGIDTEIKEYDFQKAFQDDVYYSKNGFTKEFFNFIDALKNRDLTNDAGEVIKNQASGIVQKMAENMAQTVSSETDSRLIDAENKRKKGQAFLKKLLSDKPSGLTKKGKIELASAIRYNYQFATPEGRKVMDSLIKKYKITDEIFKKVK